MLIVTIKLNYDRKTTALKKIFKSPLVLNFFEVE